MGGSEKFQRLKVAEVIHTQSLRQATAFPRREVSFRLGFSAPLQDPPLICALPASGRMRLLQRAAKSKSNTSSALAEVVRKAVRNAHKL